MKMTTGTNIFCPHCKKELQVETEGLLGGVLQQLFLQSAMERLRKEGGKIKCGSCGKIFYMKGMRHG